MIKTREEFVLEYKIFGIFFASAWRVASGDPRLIRSGLSEML